MMKFLARMQRPDPDESARSNPSAMAMGRSYALKDVEFDGSMGRDQERSFNKALDMSRKAGVLLPRG